MLAAFQLACSSPLLAAQPADQVATEQNPQMSRAIELITSGKPAEAMPLLDSVIASNQARRKGSDGQVFCSRTTAEALVYMAESAAAKRSAVAVDDDWCNALFFKGFALIDLGQPAQGRSWIERAVAMAPHNAHYKGELAESYKAAREWPKAYSLFEETVEDAQSFSPDDLKSSEVTRGLRGLGFVLIEQGKLDEAKAKFEECLKLNPDDERAKGELRYIEEQKAKSTPV
jgi:tetratricopeptide (TPR) repeat protein